ncbi:MAG: MotA/TolQ/ExbB proton channel family protein [Myxococcota bacterium]|nr:MotA/TolQ/ExbB proton channel family protein [Myxococcota bacterium]
MKSQRSCPYCAATADFPEVGEGEVADCPSCDRSFVLPGGNTVVLGAETRALPVAGELPLRLPDPERSIDGHSRDVSLTRTGLIAVGGTALFYITLVLPLSGTYFGELFGARGWVPYVISYLSIWCGALLVAKYVRVRRRVQALALDFLPEAIADEVTPENVPVFLDYLSRLPGQFSEDFLFQRIRRCLEHFQSRGRVSETVDQLRLDSERDEGTVESSYTMLRVFIWAIPILGFIGTVLGIGASVSGFSEAVASAVDLDVMKDSIGVVTTGLGVAFDTTLIALVMSIFIMVPTSSLQKTEEDYLARVDDYCQRRLVARLSDGAGSGQAAEASLDAAADRFASKIIEAFDRRMPGVD